MKITNNNSMNYVKMDPRPAVASKFIGLLPEVNHRRLYEEKGFHLSLNLRQNSVAFQPNWVRLTLNLEKDLG